MITLTGSSPNARSTASVDLSVITTTVEYRRGIVLEKAVSPRDPQAGQASLEGGSILKLPLGLPLGPHDGPRLRAALDSSSYSLKWTSWTCQSTTVHLRAKRLPNLSNTNREIKSLASQTVVPTSSPDLLSSGTAKESHVLSRVAKIENQIKKLGKQPSVDVAKDEA
ncbi:hypothetical protein N7541_008194 [Penicillium brevicompactum]|uniref:Uncharacterized protein n=1 Tax=Penicillium brevicompactum TaxID=5074 RepID=A0A9W9QYI0_PENBR|nr:hypothetical protein N7541_008194 [Penicillium brevicompactum]